MCMPQLRTIKIGDWVQIQFDGCHSTLVYVDGIERDEDDRITGLMIWTCGEVPAHIDGDLIERISFKEMMN